MPRTAQIIKRDKGQSIQKILRSLKVQSQKPSSIIMKLAFMRTHRNGRPIISFAAEDKFIRVTSLRNCSPNKCFRVQITNTSQQLFRVGLCGSGLHGQIAAKKPLLKDTNKKKRHAWAKKHE
jgi:hypothetical protein